MNMAAQLACKVTLNKIFKFLCLDIPVTTDLKEPMTMTAHSIIRRMECVSSYAGSWGCSSKCVCDSKCVCMCSTSSASPEALMVLLSN